MDEDLGKRYAERMFAPKILTPEDAEVLRELLNKYDERKRVVLTRLEQTCWACPSQWDAWDAEGTYYYIRYRWGHLTVNKGDVRGEVIYDATVGDALDGHMSTETMLVRTGMILQ